MLTPTLNYPVHTLDGRQLLPSGTQLDAATLQEVAATGRDRHRFHPLLEHGSVRRDLQKHMNSLPYSVIFGASENQGELWALMEEVNIIAPCLDSLDYFQQHDPYTYRHTLMVFALTTLLARDLIPDCRDWLRESFASPTHDIGKTCVPLEVLRKTTPLKRSERRWLEHHPLAGYVLLSHYLGDHNHFAARVARDHHERKNGSGYPRGIQNTDSMVEIITVCDIYDALVSPRPYRPICFDNRSAIEEITRLAERGEIGWYVVKALVAHNRRVDYDPDEVWVSDEKRGTPPPGNAYGILLDD
jgi:HD-GYP domain-containing protein (c-di-GMP phosphodiesterase class II)